MMDHLITVEFLYLLIWLYLAKQQKTIFLKIVFTGNFQSSLQI